MPVSTSRARKPLSMFCNVIKVRSSRPAPQSTRTAAATCTDTRPLRSQPPRRVTLPSADMASVRRPRVDCQAGTWPNRTPTANAVSAHAVATRPSNDSLTATGNTPGGTSDGAAAMSAAVTPTATRPPIDASTRLSVSSCATTRPRPAPSAALTASSRVRPVACARSRLATLAQHISSTNPTTPRSSSDVSRTSRPMRASRSGCTVTPCPLLLSGNCSASRAAIASRSACARSRLTSGFNRPTTVSR